jgi:alpha-tubulin suppressor-like RCC1 family protein
VLFLFILFIFIYLFYYFFITFKTGEVFTWGRNSYGQLGLGDVNHRFSPVRVTALEPFNIVNICAGSFHCLFVSSKGDVFAAGCATQGRLGRGDLKNCLVPRSLTDLKGKHIIQTSCGGTFSAAISGFYLLISHISSFLFVFTFLWFSDVFKAMGELYTWGSNKYGQLGQGKISVTSVPQRVTALFGKKIVNIICGRHHTTAIADK